MKICCYRFNFFHSIGNFSKLLHYFFHFIIVCNYYIERLGDKPHYFCYRLLYNCLLVPEKYSRCIEHRYLTYNAQAGHQPTDLKGVMMSNQQTSSGEITIDTIGQSLSLLERIFILLLTLTF